jgi:hypothetical protein
VTELARGRKATIAKDFAAAEAHFTQSLAALPGDARALSERGYARLLAEKLPEAREDLLAAERAAPHAILRQQILHNLMLVERKAGNGAAASRYEAEKKKAKAARRTPEGSDCGSEVEASDLKPEVASSFAEALRVIAAKHAEEEHSAPAQVTYAKPGEEGHDKLLKQQAALDTHPDGATVVWTSGPNASRNHAVIAKAGTFYIYPNLSSGTLSLCGFEGLAEVAIEGGGARPWRIVRTTQSSERGYLCSNCEGLAEGEEAQTMGYCAWTGTSVDITILDGITFRGIREVRGWARPHDDGASNEPPSFFDVDWQADQAIVSVCGERQTVPYVTAAQ